MSFVIDTDICSAHLKGNAQVYNRFNQYRGGVYISILTLGELHTWANRDAVASAKRIEGISDMLADVQVLAVDEQVATRFGVIRAGLLGRGVVVDVVDLFIAATALEFNFTVITHNVKHFRNVPGLRIDDWLAP